MSKLFTSSVHTFPSQIFNIIPHLAMVTLSHLGVACRYICLGSDMKQHMISMAIAQD